MASELNEETRKFLIDEKGMPLKASDKAYEVLRRLFINQERIIENRGLQEINGKLYQIFPWEKVILKTSSFMRGDFFKTCFCLVQFEEGKHLTSQKDKFVSISPTQYSEEFTNKEINAKNILRDLLMMTKRTKDYVFRTFVEDYYYDEKVYIPNSILTGKSENILVGKNHKKIETLARYKDALSGNGTGQVVKSIENENIGTRIFTPVEQALTHLNVSPQLGIGLKLSEEALDFEMIMKDWLEQELRIDIEKIIIPTHTKRL